VHGPVCELDAAEVRADVVAQELVVVPGQVDQARSFPHLAQELLHHVVVGLWPVPAGPEAPAVDDVADEVDHVRVVVPEKVEQQLGLAPPRPEMDVRQEQGAHPNGFDLCRHAGPSAPRACEQNGIRVAL
jgi:hypothetical protein